MSAACGGEIRLSVIIPAWHDAKNLDLLLPQLARIDGIVDVIVCDASNDIEAQNLTQRFGTMFVRCSAANRGAQMNAGFIFASANVLLFHPPDVDLRSEHVQALQRAMLHPETIGGAFHQLYGWLSLAPGKQSIFVRRQTFLQLGGFTKVPEIDDIDFSRRLRRAGRTVMLDPPVRKLSHTRVPSSAPRSALRAAIATLLYRCHISPERL